MSILDANADSLELQAGNSLKMAVPKTEPGTWHNFASGAGTYFMRSMAEAGRSASMAAAAVPVAVDWATSKDSMLGQALGDKGLADRYFEWHDDTFGRAVDYWTPSPVEVGAAGQIVGQLSGGIVKFLASPALSIADVQLSTGENLVRQGVDATTAQVAGGIAGAAQAVGIRLPAAVGNTLGTRLATGAAGNVAQGLVATGAQRVALEVGGAPQNVLDQFDPLDVRARGIDAVMGLVFGAKAHVEIRAGEITQAQKDALLLLNQSRQLGESSLPGRPATPADQAAGMAGVRQAMDQMLRGEPVAVDSPLPDFTADPRRAEVAATVEAELPKGEPIKPPAPAEPEAPKVDEPGKPAEAGAEARPQFDESVKLPTGEFDPVSGEERVISANEYIAKAEADAAKTTSTAEGLMQAAASCLLGSL